MRRRIIILTLLSSRKISLRVMSFFLTQCSVCRAAFSVLCVSVAHSRTATGGSAIKAVEVLMEHGVPEERIIFINLVCSLLSHDSPG